MIPVLYAGGVYTRARYGIDPFYYYINCLSGKDSAAYHNKRGAIPVAVGAQNHPARRSYDDTYPVKKRCRNISLDCIKTFHLAPPQILGYLTPWRWNQRRHCGNT
jgi:hypothetical protein